MLDGTTFDPRPMIIDSFAGGGGASTGIELALGRSPDVAINHSGPALALHEANHPDTIHLNSNIWDVRPLEVTKGRPVGLLWASPDCKHFSKAKGGAPRDRNIRDLAWIVVDWAEQAKPDVILMENVEEFRTWGHVDEYGQPMKEFVGQIFEMWVKRLKKAGYRVQWRELRACDYGAPTIRKRFFMIARRDGRPIVWPKPTHADPASAAVKRGKLLPWRTAAECIDWSLACPSIFDTKAEVKEKHGLTAVRPLKPNTLARVARGMKRYVLEAESPFLVNLTHGGRIQDPAEPFRTITGAHCGEKAVIAPSLIRTDMTSAVKRNGIYPLQDPVRTQMTSQSFALIAPSLQRFNSGATGSDLRDPMPTVTANSYIKRPGGAAPLGVLAPYLASIAHGDSGGRREYPLADPLGTVTVGGIQHALIAPSLMSLKGTARRACAADMPHPTVLAGGGHSSIIAPLLATMRNSQKPWQGPDEPTHTITAGGAGLSVIAPVLTYAQQGGGNRDILDPHHTICASRKDQNSFIAATMVHVGNGERQGQAPRALDVQAPLNTVVAGGVKHYPVAAFLAQQNGGPRMENHAGHDIGNPISTIAASGSHQTPIAAFFAKYYGTGDGAATTDPLHTVTVKDRFSHVQATLDHLVDFNKMGAPPFTPDHEARAREVAEFLRAHGAWEGGEFVTLTIGGATYVVVDIGMRMLTPRELFNAQGFPADYVIEGVWEGEGDTSAFRAFPKDVQVSCCGNSVCPPLAEAIVRANCAHLKADEVAA